jgi:DNA-binding response OmpR family regulator
MQAALESAKHTVITAYSAGEGITMFRRFSKRDAVVIDSELNGNQRLAKEIREESPKIRVVCVDSRIGRNAVGRTKPLELTTQ